MWWLCGNTEECPSRRAQCCPSSLSYPWICQGHLFSLHIPPPPLPGWPQESYLIAVSISIISIKVFIIFKGLWIFCQIYRNHHSESIFIVQFVFLWYLWDWCIKKSKYPKRKSFVYNQANDNSISYLPHPILCFVVPWKWI